VTVKILLAVTTHWPGPDLAILSAAWAAAQRSGAHEARLLTVGAPAEILDAVHVGPNRGHQEGERDLVWGAIREAERLGCDWIVKCAGDCIHAGDGWARAWVDAAKGMEATVIGDRWPELHNWKETGNTTELLRVMPQTKVFASSVRLLKATWPLADSGFIERDWELRIKQGGWWPLIRLVAGDEVEATGGGSQQFWNAKAGPLRFKHCHSAGEL
jgi:hypothetical protein